jgi:rubrerythrin
MGTKAHRARAGRASSGDKEAVQDVGVQLEESATAPSAPAAPAAPAALPLDGYGFVDFAAAGTHVSGEFRCADCGYGAVVHRALPPCPMCGGTVWESRAPRSVD